MAILYLMQILGYRITGCGQCFQQHKWIQLQDTSKQVQVLLIPAELQFATAFSIGVDAGTLRLLLEV